MKGVVGSTRARNLLLFSTQLPSNKRQGVVTRHHTVKWTEALNVHCKLNQTDQFN
jgi:hypothetical protein